MYKLKTIYTKQPVPENGWNKIYLYWLEKEGTYRDCWNYLCYHLEIEEGATYDNDSITLYGNTFKYGATEIYTPVITILFIKINDYETI